MSTQTVVDVVISGSTTTVVDKRIDGVTTVAGAPPVTNVSGQIPDLGVDTDILATEGDILSLTNDVANLRANLIVTGTTLTDEIGVLSGHLISTGNNLEFQISTLSGNLIASGNNLDSLRDVLSGNLITTGQDLLNRITNSNTDISSLQTATGLLSSATGALQENKFNKAGGTISGSIIPNASGTLNLGSESKPFLSGYFKDLTVSNNTLFIGDVPIHASNGGIDFRSATGTTEFKDVSIRNLTVTGTEVIIDVEHLGVKDNTIVINSGEQGAGITAGSGGIVIDRGTLPDADIIFNETNDNFEIDFPLSIEGSLAVKRSETGSFADDSDISSVTTNLIATGRNLQTQISNNDNDILTLTNNLNSTGQTLQVQIDSNDSDISTLTSNISTTGQTLQTQITSNDSDISSLTSNLVTTGQTLTTRLDQTVSNLATSGQILQTQITSNDSDIATLTSNLSNTGEALSGNLISTGNFLDAEIAIVSGLTTGVASDPALSGKVDDLSGNLITTGQTLTSEIAIVSGIATGRTDTSELSGKFNALSGNLITTGQTLTTDVNNVSSKADNISGNLIATGQTLQTQISSNDSDISTLTSNLSATGETLETDLGEAVSNLATTGQILQVQITSNDSDISSLTSNLITTGQTLTSEINTVSGLITDNDGDISDLKAATGVLKTSTDNNASNLISTGNFLESEISIVSGLTTGSSSDPALSGKVDTLSGNLITTGQTLQTQITSNDSDISTLTSNLVTTGQTLTSEIAIVSGIAENASDEALSGRVDTLSGNLITTGQTLQTQITSNDSDISSLTSNLVTTGQTLTTDITTVSGLIVDNDGDITALKTATGVLKTSTDSNASNLITTGQTLQTQITSNDGDISTLTTNLGTTGQTLQTQITSNDSDINTLTSNLITTGQTLTTDISTVSGLITDNDDDITALKSATGVLKTSTDTNTTNLITTGQTLQTQITSNDSDISTLTTNLGTTGQTLQTQITSNDSDITSLTSNLITTGQTLTTDINTVSGLITDNDADITALKTATGVLKTSSDNNTANLITTGQTLQTQITSNDGDITTLTSNLATTGQTLTTNVNTVSANLISTGVIVDDISGNLITTGQALQTQITSNDSDITNLTSNLITTGQTLTNDVNTVSGLITDNDADITALKNATGVLKTSTDSNTANLIATGSVIDDVSGNLITTGQTLQTQITSNDGDITTLTSNLVTTGQTLTTNINTVATNLGTSGQTLQTQITSNDSDISTLTSNLGTTGQTLQTQITSNDSDIASLTTNLGTTGQTLQTQITSNDSDISTLDSTTVKLTTNQSIAGNKIFTNDVTINNLTVTGTEVVVDVENLAVKDNIIEINSGESSAGISRISGGIVIDRGTATNANILYNDANDRFELNFPLAVEGEVVASASNLITTGQTLTTNINTVSTNLGTSGQTLQTQITSNDSDISTLTTNLGTTGQTLQTQITSNDSDISTLTTNLGTTGQTLQTQITNNDSDISTLTSNLVTTGQTLQTQITSNDSDISTLTTNLGATGQTLQTQITSNDSDISTLTSNLVTTGQTLTTNINTVSTNLGTSGQTLQTQITSNDTDITNLSSNLVTTGQTLTTNINTVATNLVTTGQTLTSEIATVSGLIPATVIDGGGTANKVPLWSDGNTIGDSVISQSSSKIGIGTASPDRVLHVKPTSNVPAIKVGYDGTQGNGSLLEFDNGYTQKFYVGMSDTYASRDFVIAEISTGASTDATNPKYVFNGNGDGSFYITDAADNDVKVLLNTNGDSYLNGGAVGINTTSPSARIHVNGAVSDILAKFVDGSDGVDIATRGANRQQIDFLGSNTSAINAKGSLRINYDSDNTGTNDSIVFGRNGADESGTADLTINEGNVGIGTNAPTEPLHVESTAADILINSTTANQATRIRLKTTSHEYRIGTQGTVDNFWIYDASNSAYRMVISPAGAVGINTTSPNASSKLHVYGWTIIQSATNFASLRLQSTTGSWDIDNNDGTFGLQWAGGDKFNITSAGSVGIGTNSPAEILEVVSDSDPTILIRPVTVDSANSGKISYRENAGGTTGVDLRYDGANNRFSIDTSDVANALVIKRTDGNVGIGTNAPTKMLEVSGTSAAIRIHDTGSNVNQSLLLLGSDLHASNTKDSWIKFFGGAATNDRTWSIGHNGNAMFRFNYLGTRATAPTGGTTVLNLDGINNRVGIGGVDPDQKLEVWGAIKSSGAYGFYAGRADTTWASFGTGVPTILLRGTADNSRAGAVQFKEYDGTDTAAIYSTDGTDGYGFVMAAYQGDIKFATGSLSGYKMVILSGGSVGIGTNAPDTKLHIEGTTKTSATIESTGNHAELIIKSENNTYSPYVVFKDAGADRYFIQANPSDSLLFRPQGTGTTSKWVVFNSNGSVGIGTETPGAKLHVNGYARIGNPHANEDQASTLILSNSTGGSATHDFLTLADTANNGSETGRIVFKARYGTGSFSAGQEATFISSIRNGTSGAYHLAFGTTNDSSADAVERVRISSLGNVGIGTNNPGYKLDVNGTAHIATAQDSVAPLTLKSTYNGSTAGPLLDLYRKSGTPADGDNLGTITFTADTNVGSINEFARIESTALDVTDTTEDGALKLAVVTAGTSRSRVYMDSTETVFNDASQDFDFRVESDNDTNALFVQGSSGSIGIGTGAPSEMLHINKSSGTGSFIRFQDTGGGGVYIGARSNVMELYAGGAERMRIASDGKVGIGVSPAYKLQVSGDIYMNGGNFLMDHNYEIRSKDSGGTTRTIVRVNSNVLQYGWSGSGNVLFMGGGSYTERMRINASGGAVTFNNAFTFPTTDGSANQVLQTDGSGTVTWSSAGTGTISGSGTDNYIPRFNGTSALENSILYDTGSTLSVGTTSPNAVGGTSVLYLSGQSNMIVMSSSNVFNNSSYIRHLGTAHFQWQTYNGSNTGYIELQPYGGQVAIGMRGTTTTYNLHIGAFGADDVNTFRIDGTNGSSETAAFVIENDGANGKVNFKHNIGNGTPATKLTLDHNGNIGIGTNAPGAKLHVRGSDGYLKFDTSGADGTIKSDYNLKLYADDNNNNSSGYQNIQFYTAGANERMRITSDGKVLINATAPTLNTGSTLYVNGNAYASEFELPSGGKLDWANGDATIEEGLTSNYSLSLRNYDGSSAMVTTMFLKSGGNVGIGTVAPAAHLHVSKASGTTTVLTQVAANSAVGFEIKKTGSTTQHWKIVDGQTANGTLEFYDATNSATRMAITGSGSVGLNKTPNSQYNLDIEGQMLLGGHMNLKATNSLQGIGFNRNVHTGAIYSSSYYAYQLHSNANNFELQRYNGSGTFLGYGLVCTAVGNIGIGTNNPGEMLQVGDGSVNGTSIEINSASWAQLKLTSPNTNGAYIMFGDPEDEDIGNIFYYHGSNANYMSFTTNASEQMRIDKNGNVGIGTNAPLDKLDVYGTGAIFRNLSDNADSVQIVRGTNHNANPDAKFYIYDNSSADWAAKINLDGASYGLDIQNGSDFFLLCRKAGGDRLLEVHGSQTIVNGGGIDYDFRVESNNDDYLLFTEGSTDRVAISTTAPAAKLHVEGDFKVGTTNNGNWMGYKDVSLNGTTYTTALTINLANHTGCYVKLFLSGDWSSHSAVAFVGEYFIQNGSDGYAEPGTVISEFDNTNTDSIESKIVDPSSDTFTIQLKLSTAANGTLGGKLSYHVMGMATAVS